MTTRIRIPNLVAAQKFLGDNAHPNRVARLPDFSAKIDVLLAVDPSQGTVDHILRSNGFGGSEIGVLAAEFLGERPDFGSAHRIVESKRYLAMPEEPTPAMRRGTALEGTIRKLFYKKMGCVRDEESYAKIATGRGMRSWMRYSPDDVVLMNDSSGKPLRYLIDFKSPYAIGGDDVDFGYACQLHQGRMVAKANDIQIDGMVLVQLDLQNWNTVEKLVIHDTSIDETILEAGDHYWGFVMRDEPAPRLEMKPKQTVTPDDPEFNEIRDLVKRFAVTKALADKATHENETARNELAALFSRRAITGKVDLDLISPSFSYKTDLIRLTAAVGSDLAALAVTLKPDESKMISELIRLGVPVDQWQSPEIDKEKVTMLLATNQIDARSVGEQSMRITSPKDGKNPHVDYLRAQSQLSVTRFATQVESYFAELVPPAPAAPAAPQMAA